MGLESLPGDVMDKVKTVIMFILFGVMSACSIQFVALMLLGGLTSFKLGWIAGACLVGIVLIGLTVKETPS